MARAKANKLYRTFVKGLVTEASPLTYPEDASYDELNTILSRKGSRTRRLGIDYLSNTLDATAEVTNLEISQNEFVWKAVARKANTNFLVVQKGFIVRFYDMMTTVYTDSVKPFEVDLSDYLIPGAILLDAEKETFQFSFGKGYLFVVGRSIEPIVIEYLPATDDIVVTKIVVQIRDFDGLNDGLSNDTEPPTLSKEHHYNLLNQGWLYGSATSEVFSPTSYDGYIWSGRFEVINPYEGEIVESYSAATPTSGPIQKFFDAIGRYPGNNKQWWVARAEADNSDEGIVAGDFLPNLLNNLYSGNNRAPTGHFILNAFRKDRAAVSGVSDILVEEENSRPEAIAFFSGRAWYGAGSTVYFSQILDSTGVHKAGLCYQEADPTAEDISDLIASDGGVVNLPEADRIVRMVPMANGVLVFAQNGVWFISGGDQAFAAVSIAADKVTSIGTKSPLAAVEIDGTLFWWNETGIQALTQAQGQFGPIPGKFGNSSISEQTIQTLFNEISEDSKKYVKVCFDPRTNRLMWIFNDTYDGKYQYNKCLLFDLTLQAFFLWEFANIEDGPTVSGIYNDVGESFATTEDLVISGGQAVTTIALVSVVAEANTALYTPTSIKFLVNVPGDGMAISETDNTGYVDWSTYDGDGIEYESFIETGYELMDDAMRKKQAIYVFAFFRREENASCFMTAKWDWSTNSYSNKWSTEIQAYRERIRPNNSTADLEGFEVVTTKNKVRGSGKSVQFKFGTSEAGKNYELLGWAVAFVGNTEP